MPLASQYLLSTIGNRLNYTPMYVNYAGKKRYYSSVDAKIYLDNVELEEIDHIIWTVQEAHMPLYGYNSYVYDEVAVGSRLIQGQFAINYIIPDYLQSILEKKIAATNDNELDYTINGNTFEQSKRQPIWNKGFDIAVMYGKNNSNIFLEDVHVQSQGQAIDINTDGKLVEMYSFIARDKSHKR